MLYLLEVLTNRNDFKYDLGQRSHQKFNGFY